MRYQNREVVEAEQWFPGKPTPGVRDDHPPDAIQIRLCGCIMFGFEGGRPHIHGSRLCQGTFLDPGDWVIKNADFGYSRMKPAEFEARYGPVRTAEVSLYRCRVEFEGGPIQNYFSAANDREAVLAVLHMGETLAPTLTVPITRTVVEAVAAGPITAGVCETTADRRLYDSDDPATSILP